MVNQSATIPNLCGHTVSAGYLRLRLHQPLGSGVYGVVYLATDLPEDSPSPVHYAVKVVLKHAPDTDRSRQQWREINYHRSISGHPHVVTLHGVVEEESYLYLVMDYCPGGDLFSSIIDRQSFVANDARIKRVFGQLIDGLHLCHEKGVFHRDLKPENILMSADDSELYIGDFGLSTRNKHSGSFGCGSSLYMSPECIGVLPLKRPFDTARSDIWALGVILINLITGRCPWHLASPAQDEGFRLFVAEGPSYLRAKLPLSRGAADLLGRIFTMDPDQRITLAELQREVQQMDTFFMFPEPIAVPVPYNKERARTALAGPEKRQRRKARVVDGELQEVDVADVRAARRAPYAAPRTSAASRTPAARVATSLVAHADLSEQMTGSRDITAASARHPPRSDQNPGMSSGSTDESDVLETPPFPAQEPASAIPVSTMVLGQDAGADGTSRTGLVALDAKPQPYAVEKRPELTAWRRLSNFMQKMRIAA